jgi:hypothetical protein
MLMFWVKNVLSERSGSSNCVMKRKGTDWKKQISRNSATEGNHSSFSYKVK